MVSLRKRGTERDSSSSTGQYSSKTKQDSTRLTSASFSVHIFSNSVFCADLIPSNRDAKGALPSRRMECKYKTRTTNTERFNNMKDGSNR